MMSWRGVPSTTLTGDAMLWQAGVWWGRGWGGNWCVVMVRRGKQMACGGGEEGEAGGLWWWS